MQKCLRSQSWVRVGEIEPGNRYLQSALGAWDGIVHDYKQTGPGMFRTGALEGQVTGGRLSCASFQTRIIA